jgi:hypothetical protein
MRVNAEGPELMSDGTRARKTWEILQMGCVNESLNCIEVLQNEVSSKRVTHYTW